MEGPFCLKGGSLDRWGRGPFLGEGTVRGCCRGGLGQEGAQGCVSPEVGVCVLCGGRNEGSVTGALRTSRGRAGEQAAFTR